MPHNNEFSEQTFQNVINIIGQRLLENKRVRRKLPGGRVHIDRRLPFLCVFRQSPHLYKDGTERLVVGEASYVIVDGDTIWHDKTVQLCKQIIEKQQECFRTFLIVEVWPSQDNQENCGSPCFTIQTSDDEYSPLRSTLLCMKRELQKIHIMKKACDAHISYTSSSVPPGLCNLFSEDDLKKYNCHVIGLEVPTLYFDHKNHQIYPIELQKMRRGISRVFKKTFFEFIRSQTANVPPHYLELGRKAMVKAVWDTDNRFALIEQLYDYLLLSTPLNVASERKKYFDLGYKIEPTFYYRPLPIDPMLLKRLLYNIPIERIEDPMLENLFREKQAELDNNLSMIMNRGTDKYLYGSINTYGAIDTPLLRLAQNIFKKYVCKNNQNSKNSVDAKTIKRYVEKRMLQYHKAGHDLSAKCYIRNDVSGIIVVKGDIYIGSDLTILEDRVDALIAHEIDTHVLTHYNATLQPLQMLVSGFPGYEELQEGLGIIAEYCVGGLNSHRLRMLAGRVIAAHEVMNGKSFNYIFKLLTDTYGFHRKNAFDMTMRVCRSGGLTKDCIYLRGLMKILDYFKDNGDIETLFIGKIGFPNIPLIKELLYREIICKPPVIPLYLHSEKTHERMTCLKNGVPIDKLIQ